MEADNPMLPVKPATGVTVMMDVLAEVAPCERVIALPLMVKLGGTAVSTVTEAVPLAAK